MPHSPGRTFARPPAGPVVAALLAAVALLAAGPRARAQEDKYPVFTLAWSEYPSWSVFGVASDRGLINGERGKLGLLEKQWGVDIELQLLDYARGITSYTAKQSDAVCVTNTDALNAALARKSVAVLPTSTSAGADALIVAGVKDLDDLKNYEVYGQGQSVSDYAFYRLLEKNGKNPKDYKWKDLDPGAAANQLAAKSQDVKAIMVWNPFVLQTLRNRPDAKVLFDTSQIPEEIIDMVVVGDDVLDRPKGKEFACCLIQTFYEFNVELTKPARREQLLVDLGKRFSSLDAKDMAECLKTTRFYKTPEEGLKLFKGDLLPKTMERLVKDYAERKIISTAPTVGFGPAAKAPNAQLRFDPTFIQTVKDKL